MKGYLTVDRILFAIGTAVITMLLTAYLTTRLNEYKIEKLEGLVNKHEECIYGNENGGMKTDIAVIKSDLKSISGDIEEIKEYMKNEYE